MSDKLKKGSPEKVWLDSFIANTDFDFEKAGKEIDYGDIVKVFLSAVGFLKQQIDQMKNHSNCLNISDDLKPCSGMWRDSFLCPCTGWQLKEIDHGKKD
jgi:hypothetical protein